jgi:hypothetical protein
VFLTVLHRLFVRGSDRAVDRWREREWTGKKRWLGVFEMGRTDRVVRIPPQHPHNVSVSDTPNTLPSRDPKRHQFVDVVLLNFAKRVFGYFLAIINLDGVRARSDNFFPRLGVKFVGAFHHLFERLTVLKTGPSKRTALVAGTEAPRQRRSIDFWVFYWVPSQAQDSGDAWLSSVVYPSIIDCRSNLP